MDVISIKLLKSLVEGQKETNELLNLLGIKKRRLAYMIKNLVEEDYIEKENTIVRLKKTPKAILFRDIAQVVPLC